MPKFLKTVLARLWPQPGVELLRGWSIQHLKVYFPSLGQVRETWVIRSGRCKPAVIVLDRVTSASLYLPSLN